MAKTAYDDFISAVALGLVPGYTLDTKFGRNPLVSTTQETIRNLGGTMPYLDPGVSAPLSVVSDNVDDAGKTITLTGLDDSYNPQVVTATLDATDPTTTPVLTDVSFHRFFRAGMIPQVNTGIITISSTAPGTPVFETIAAGEGQTLMALFTVPSGKTAYIIKAFATIEGTKIATLRAKTRLPGEDFRTKRIYDLSASLPSDIFVQSAIPEKTDYELTAVTDVPSAGISANVLYMIIDNSVIGR